MSLDYSKLPELVNTEPCGRCGRGQALGIASIDGVAYCHGDHSQGNPTCYMQQSWDLIDRHGPAATAISQKDQDRIAALRRQCDELAVSVRLDGEDT